MSALRILSALFDVDTAKAQTSLKQLDGAISQTKGMLGTLATSALGAFSIGAIKDFVEGQISAAKEVRLTAAKLGVGTEALEQFQFAAGSAGVSAEGAATGLKFLNKNLGEAIAGNADAAQTFKDLGINLADVKNGSLTATDAIPAISEKFQKMGSQAERTAFAMKVFGRQGADLLPFLEQGPVAIQQLTDRFHELGGGMSAEFIAKAKEAGRAMGGLNFGIGVLKRQVAAELFPVFTAYGEALQKVVGWVVRLTQETTVVRTALSLLGIVGAAGAAKAAFGWAKFFGIFAKGSGTLAGGLKSLVSFGATGLIIGGIAAAALAVDDLAVAFDGGDSAIKDFLTKAGGVEYATKYIDEMKDAWEQSKGSIEQLQEPLTEVGKQIADLAKENAPEIIYAFDYIARVIGTAVVSLVTFIKLLGQLKNIADDDFTKKVDKILGNYTDTLFGKEDGKGNSYGGLWGDKDPNKRPAAKMLDGPSYLDPSSKDYMGDPYAPPQAVAGAGTTNVGGDTNITNGDTTINVTVNGADTNDATGRVVGARVRREIDAAADARNAAALAAMQVGATAGGGL